MYMQIIYLIQNIITGMHAQNSGLAGEQLSATCTRPREEDYAPEDSGEEEEREHTCEYINNIVHIYRCAHIHTYIHTVLIHKFIAIASQETLNLLRAHRVRQASNCKVPTHTASYYIPYYCRNPDVRECKLLVERGKGKGSAHCKATPG